MGTSASAEDRRLIPRRPFSATVELALAEDVDGYEADAVDLSVGGMALRTAFLPDVGSELECRFALEGGQSIAARAEVVWARDTGAEAGAFGLRFRDLAGPHEHAIRGSFPVDALVLDETEAQAAKADGSGHAKARLFLPGMEAPLRTRVRTSMDDALVLGSELSFLKLGEPVEVERDGERVAAAIEDVSVEVDPRTSIACLVLTLAVASRASATPSRPAIVPARGACDDAEMPAIPKAPRPPSLRPAQATAVLASSDDDAAAHAAMHAGERVAMAADSKGAHPVMEMATGDVLASASPRRAPPAWLVASLGRVRGALRWLALHAGPGVRRAVVAIVAVASRAYAAARTRLGDRSEPALDGARYAGPSLRKQHKATVADAAGASSEPRVAWFARGRYGLYGLAAVGTVAIIAALATGRREPHARPPHPTVAVAAPADGPALPDPATTAPTTDPMAAAVAADPSTNAMPEPVAPPTGEARRMPSDLVAAARSRSANVDDAPTLRYGRAAPVGSPRAATLAAHAAAPALLRTRTPVAPTVAVASAPPTHTIGNPAVRVGTTLRLRMDGPVAGLTGGAAGNTITLHLAGRRSLDLAAPLVHQDTRLINAGVYNHGGNVDLTLRFRGAVPAFAARGRNDTLEIVLAPVTVAAAAPTHRAPRAMVASLRRRPR